MFFSKPARLAAVFSAFQNERYLSGWSGCFGREEVYRAYGCSPRYVEED